MCHFREFDREWGTEREREETDDEEDGLPSFLKEETDTDVEMLTDGGESDGE